MRILSRAARWSARASLECGEAAAEFVIKPRSPLFRIGESPARLEDRRFLAGHGRFVDDLELPGAAHAVFVRSLHAHARVKKVHTSDAQAIPGVLAVLSGEDWNTDGKGSLTCMYAVPSSDGTPMREAPRPVLVSDCARHVGDPIAMVVAESLPLAMDAAEAIQLDMEPLDSMLDLRAATCRQATLVHPRFATNVAYDWALGDENAVGIAFANAKHVVEVEILNNRVHGLTLEPRAVAGRYDARDDSYTLWSTTQIPHVIRDCLATDSLRVPAHRIRVVAPDVGGGFGVKGSHYCEEAAVLWASKRIGRAVRWTSTRTESFVADVHARDQLAEGKIAFDASGRVLGIRVDVVANLGAYASLFGAGCASIFGSGAVCGPYNIPAAYFRVRGVYTNTVPIEAYRGAGMPEAANVIERLMDAGAQALGADPLTHRVRNLLESHTQPVTNALGVPHDSGSYREAAEKLLGRYAEWRERQHDAPGRFIGIGIAGYVMQASGGPSRDGLAIGSRLSNWEHVRICVHAGGEVTVACGTHSHGQGHETTFRQLVSSKLGCDPRDIEIVYGDTARVHAGLGTYASRAMVIAGNAINQASERIIAKGKLLAAHEFECAPEDVEFDDGGYRVAGTDREIPFHEVAAAAWRGDGWPEDFEPGLDESCYFEPPQGTTPSGFHLCVIEIDRDTGAVTLLDYFASDDFGKVINPTIVDGQVHGAVTQGLGQALGECCFYDDTGQLLAGSLTDYWLPRAADLPSFHLTRIETPAPGNPLGVKGMGEAGALPAPPAVANAIRDACSSTGCSMPDMPFTPHRVWRALNTST